MEALLQNLGISGRTFSFFNKSSNKTAKMSASDSKKAKHIMQGNSFFNLGMYKKAIKSYKNALKANPHNNAILFNLGLAYKNENMFKEAATAFQQVVKGQHTHGEAHYYLGLCYASLSMYKYAKRSLQQALIIDPDNASARYNLAIIYLKYKDTNSAIREYRNLNKISPVLAGKLSELLNNESE